MALYIMVMSTALIVSVLGLAGLTIVRIERKQASSMNGRLIARSNARSAVDLALRVTANDSGWRTTYTNGVESTPQSLGPNGTGTVSWVLEDTDGSLTDVDTNLRLKGIGRVGNIVQVSSIGAKTVVGPQELRSQTNQTDFSDDGVKDAKWWCQYLKVSLPAGATGWRITSVEIYCKRHRHNRTLNVRIYEPLATNMPSSTTNDSVDISSNAFSDAWQWQTIEFSGTYLLDPADGVCIAFETTREPIKLRYTSGGVSEPDSALIRGDDEDWDSYETDKALLYRVHGIYISHEMQPIMGSWLWDTP